MLINNEKIENLRSAIKFKDKFLSETVPGIIKSLKEALGNFVNEVDKTIIETGNTRFPCFCRGKTIKSITRNY